MSDTSARRAVAGRLQSRQADIEQALLLAIPHALRDPLSDSDADFASAQGKAISAALDYALKTLAGAPGRSVAVPGAVLEQVRLSARHSVGLDVVISLYVAGRELLGDIVAADAERHGTDAGRAVQAVLGSLLRKLVPIIARTYHEEAERLRRSQRQRRADRIRGLLDGESVDVASLGYDFDGWHTAVIISGAEAPAARSALGRLSCQALFVTQHEETVWGWLRDSKPVAVAEIEKYVQRAAFQATSFAIGEPAHGLGGWRLSHRLAQEARRVALVAPRYVATYASVGVLAPWALDRPLALAFIDVHLGPLATMRDAGASARKTLRAIFEAGHQVAPAASSLGVDRGTLTRRLRQIERQLGIPLRTRQAELEIALRLEALYGISRDPRE